MDTQTIERPDTDERVDDGTDDDTPKVFHYVKKDKIVQSAVEGTHVVALCGEVFPVTKSAKPGSPTLRTVMPNTRINTHDHQRISRYSSRMPRIWMPPVSGDIKSNTIGRSTTTCHSSSGTR